MNFSAMRAVFCAAALVGAMSLSACGAVDDIKDKSNDYPAQVEKNFVDSCVTSGGDQATCQCSFDEIEKNVTLDEFAKIEENMGAELPPEFESAIRSCMDAS